MAEKTYEVIIKPLEVSGKPEVEVMIAESLACTVEELKVYGIVGIFSEEMFPGGKSKGPETSNRWRVLVTNPRTYEALLSASNGVSV